MNITIYTDGEKQFEYMSSVIPRTGEVIEKSRPPAFWYEVKVVEYNVNEAPVMQCNVSLICIKII